MTSDKYAGGQVRALVVANQKCEPHCEPAGGTHPNACQQRLPICALAARNLRSYCAFQGRAVAGAREPTRRPGHHATQVREYAV